MLPLPLQAVSVPLQQLQERMACTPLASLLADLDAAALPALSGCDLELLLAQGLLLSSPQRQLSLELLRFAQCSEPAPAQVIPLLLACLRAGRLDDLLALQQAWAPDEPEARQSRLIAAYRLGDWRQVCALASSMQPGELPHALLRMAARAHLELGMLEPVDPLLEAMQACQAAGEGAASEGRQLELLQLWRAFSAGLAGPQEAERLLRLWPQLDPSEAACLLRFWPQLRLQLDPSRSDAPAVARLQRRCWQRLALPAMLATASGTLPALPERSAGWRVALVLAGDGPVARQQLQLLQQGFARVLPQLQLVPLLLQKQADVSPALPAGWLDLTAQTPLQRLARLREHRFDVLLDTVGPADPLWLRTLCQGLAPLQLAWFETVQPLPGSAPYQAQLADRWTLPADPAGRDVPWLSLTGIRQLCVASAGPPPPPGPAEAPVALVLLGAPCALLPGAADLLRRCLEALPVQALWFEHPLWQQPRLLVRWWQSWTHDSLPDRCRPWNPAAAAGQRLIGLDLSLESPCAAAAAWLGQGRPLVSLPAAVPSSRGVAGLLSALGLASLVQEQPQLWLEAVALLVEDPQLDRQIRAHLLGCFADSLLCDGALLARDLVQAITVLRSAEEHAA